MEHPRINLIQSTLVYSIGGMLNYLMAFLVLPFFTRILSPSDYGAKGILDLLAMCALMCFTGGVGTSIATCYFDQEQEGREATIWTAFCILFLSTVLLLIITFLFPQTISGIAFGHPAYVHLVQITLVGSVFNILALPFMLRLQLEGRAMAIVAISIAGTIIFLGTSVLLVGALHFGIKGLIESALVSQAFTFICVYAVCGLKLKKKFDFNLGATLLRRGIPLIPATIALFFMQQGGKYILRHFHDLKAVGIFTIGYSFGMLMNFAVNGFSNAWTPLFLSYQNNKDEAKILFGKLFSYYILGYGTVSLFFYTLAQPVVWIMTAPPFHEAYRVIGLVATSQFLIGAFILLLPNLYFSKEVGYLGILQPLSALLSLGFYFIFIPKYGTIGAAIALCLSYLGMFLLQIIWNHFRRETYLKIDYDWRNLFTFGLIYVIYAIGMLWTRHFSLFQEIVLSIVSSALLPVIVSRLLCPSERKSVVSYLKSRLTGGLS